MSQRKDKMKKRYKIAAASILTFVTVSLMSSCTQSEKVRSNLAQEADNFNVYRQVTVINCITGDVLLQLRGYSSIEADTIDNQLEIMTEYANGEYSKQIIGLSDNVTYIVEDLQPTDVSQYGYEINFNPNMWLPFKATTID